MNKSELAQQLVSVHTNFTDYLKILPAEEAQLSPQGKWSPVQQLDHIIKSVTPVAIAFSLPAFLLKMFFGSANRPSKSYDALVEKYRSRLASGGKAPGRFIPKNNQTRVKELSASLLKKIHSLSKKIDSFQEEQLDQLILPHPLLGKLTLREMLYFTIYHVQHHQKQVEIHRIHLH